VPSLFRYHREYIFDEGSILNYCLMVHCTKGQVGSVLPSVAKRVPAPRRFVHRLDAMIAEAFKQLLFK
jgi:hypothetical protein